MKDSKVDNMKKVIEFDDRNGCYIQSLFIEYGLSELLPMTRVLNQEASEKLFGSKRERNFSDLKEYCAIVFHKG